MSRIIVAEVFINVPEMGDPLVGTSRVKKVRVTKHAGRASMEECKLWARNFRSENGLPPVCEDSIRLIEETYL
jgi:hypothetical protein